jgi:hypothetical protein
MFRGSHSAANIELGISTELRGGEDRWDGADLGEPCRAIADQGLGRSRRAQRGRSADRPTTTSLLRASPFPARHGSA